jgi:iron complex transport system substrate-binding protein
VTAPRVVSLLPAATEIVCALGLEERLVGRSHECDHPASVARLPVCTRARIPDGNSREIHAGVGALLARGLSLYDVDVALLRELGPDVIVTQDQCSVCAVHLRDLEAALADWTGAPCQIVSLSPRTLGDVFSDFGRVGRALGAEASARHLAQRLAGRISEVGERTGALPVRPTVVCLEWLEPLMAAGNWMPELVAIAGGRSLLGGIGTHSPAIDWKRLHDADPDVLVVTACGFDLLRSLRELECVRERPEWRALRAVREGRAYVADGNAYFNRSGPRLVESLEILAEILHPARFAFEHAQRGYQRLR